MHKLLEVQETEKLMNQAKDWVAFRWLFEKPRVCQAADRVNGALDRLQSYLVCSERHHPRRVTTRLGVVEQAFSWGGVHRRLTVRMSLPR
jgi:hypothetical protein